RRVISRHPNAVTARGIFSVDRIPTGPAHGVHHLLRITDGHDGVVGPVKIPNGHVGDDRYQRRVPVTRHRNRCGIDRGIMRDLVPTPHAAQRNTGHVDAIGIEAVLGLYLVHHAHHLDADRRVVESRAVGTLRRGEETGVARLVGLGD